MKIYCAHSSAFDYQHDWYDVLRNSDIGKSHDCIFPHESDEIKSNSYSTIQSCDGVIAEVSYPSIGLGIELGWAQSLGKPIFCFYKTDARLSPSLQAIVKHCISYDIPKELPTLISHHLSHEMNHTV